MLLIWLGIQFCSDEIILVGGIIKSSFTDSSTNNSKILGLFKTTFLQLRIGFTIFTLASILSDLSTQAILGRSLFLWKGDFSFPYSLYIVQFYDALWCFLQCNFDRIQK